MSQGKQFVIRSRGVIMHQDKLLVVRHPHDKSFAALPGGHLEWGEDPRESLIREIEEELGVTPLLGRLLYVNTFVDKNEIQAFEFFIEITNAKEFLELDSFPGKTSGELLGVEWVPQDTQERILPQGFAADFKSGKLFRDETRFLVG